MIIILLENLCEDKNIDLKTINKETKIAINTLQNLYDNKASSINLNTLNRLMSYFKIKNTSEIISYVSENESKYDTSKYNKNDYE